MILYIFMIDVVYLYHKESDSISILCVVLDLAYHQSWRNSIPWEFHGSNVVVLQISIVFSLLLRQPLCNNSCTLSTLAFWSLDHIIILTSLRAWVCPPRPYTCHTLFVSHPLMGTILIQKPKSTMPQSRKHHLSPDILWCSSAIRWAPSLTHEAAIY